MEQFDYKNENKQKAIQLIDLIKQRHLANKKAFLPIWHAEFKVIHTARNQGIEWLSIVEALNIKYFDAQLIKNKLTAQGVVKQYNTHFGIKSKSKGNTGDSIKSV
jgi:hypothetical protein